MFFKSINKKEVFEWLLTLTLAIVFSLAIRQYAFQPCRVQMGSMMPTLQENDLVLVNKIDYRFNTPKRGDVIVFRPPTLTTDFYIKRVIGLPGDMVEVKNGKVYINQEIIDEPYLIIETPGNYGPTKLETDQYFVMGDHRNNSLDSREFGPIQLKSISGKACIVLWPPKDLKKI
jgi:signal peptidase I